jgi:diacylglycerol kinase
MTSIAAVAPINPLVIIAGSLSMVGGLAWNTAVESGINYYYPDTKVGKDVTAKVIYALIITAVIIIAVFVLKYVNAQAAKIEQEYEKSKIKLWQAYV